MTYTFPCTLPALGRATAGISSWYVDDGWGVWNPGGSCTRALCKQEHSRALCKPEHFHPILEKNRISGKERGVKWKVVLGVRDSRLTTWVMEWGVQERCVLCGCSCMLKKKIREKKEVNIMKYVNIMSLCKYYEFHVQNM